MVKATGKRSNAAASTPPVVPERKADPALHSLMDYGDNLEVILNLTIESSPPIDVDMSTNTAAGAVAACCTTELWPYCCCAG